MKVLHIIDTLWLGGAQTLLRSLMESDSKNQDIFLYALRKTEPQITIQHPSVICDKSDLKLSFARIFRLRRFIKANEIEVLHCHLPHSQVFGFVMKKIFFKRVKLVIHEHSDIYEKGWLLPKLLRKMQKRTDKYIACSVSVKEKLIQNARILPEKIEVIENFVDFDQFNYKNREAHRDAIRKSAKLTKYDFVIGFAGRLVERKGWKELINAANALRDEQNVIFYIAGTGPDKKKMLDLIESDQVHVLGYVSDMDWFYSVVDSIVLPSYWEGLSIVQLEAMALKIPMIHSDAPGLTDIVKDRQESLFFEMGNGNDLKEKILELFNDTGLQKQLSENAHVRVQGFGVEAYVYKLDDLYQSIR